ncbi:MAG: outer membrane beta-barrel protein [Bacteroidales bacterium]
MKCKSIILFLLLMILLPEFVQAQRGRRTAYRKRGHGYAKIMYYGLGVKYGIQYMDYNMRYEKDNYTFKPGFSHYFSVSGEYFIEYNLNLRADIQYSHRKVFLDHEYGKDVDPESNLLPEKVDWTIGYITIPIRANYNFLYTQHLKMYVAGGIAPEFKTHDMESVTYLSGRTEDHFNLLYSRRFNKVNLGGSLSAGFKYNPSAHFGIELEGGLMQYVGAVNADYSKGPPRAYYIEGGVFYDFQ